MCAIGYSSVGVCLYVCYRVFKCRGLLVLMCAIGIEVYGLLVCVP